MAQGRPLARQMLGVVVLAQDSSSGLLLSFSLGGGIFDTVIHGSSYIGMV